MIKTREATLEDIPAIRHVLSTTWHDTYATLLGAPVIDQITSEWHTPEGLKREIEEHSNYLGVAESEAGDIVGMISAIAQDERLFVSRLYVLPTQQRLGIGGRLLQACYAAFPDANEVRLYVERDNPKGRAFYQKQGFVEIGRRTDRVFGVELHSIEMSKQTKDAE